MQLSSSFYALFPSKMLLGVDTITFSQLSKYGIKVERLSLGSHLQTTLKKSISMPLTLGFTYL